MQGFVLCWHRSLFIKQNLTTAFNCADELVDS